MHRKTVKKVASIKQAHRQVACPLDEHFKVSTYRTVLCTPDTSVVTDCHILTGGSFLVALGFNLPITDYLCLSPENGFSPIFCRDCVTNSHSEGTNLLFRFQIPVWKFMYRNLFILILFRMIWLQYINSQTKIGNGKIRFACLERNYYTWVVPNCGSTPIKWKNGYRLYIQMSIMGRLC